MSIVSSSVNYATPTYSNVETESFVDNTKYFSLHDNLLDGTYMVLGSSTPLWSAALSDSAGAFGTAVLVTVTVTTSVHALHIKGDSAANVYPVDFVVTLFNGATQLYQKTVTGNASLDWLFPLTQSYDITSYTISITKINKATYTLRLTNVFNTHAIVRGANAVVTQSGSTSMSLLLQKASAASIVVTCSTNDLLTNSMNKAVSIVTNLTESRPDGIAANVGVDDSLVVTTSTNDLVTNSFESDADIVITNDDNISTTNQMGTHTDSAVVKLIPDISDVTALLNKAVNLTTFLDIVDDLVNVHSVMKGMSRTVYGKVMISYMNPLADTNFATSSTGTSYHSSVEGLLDGSKEVDKKYFTLYDNALDDASFTLMDDNSKIGWWSDDLSQVYCGFDDDPTLIITFSPRLIESLSISSSKIMDIVLVDFTVKVVANGVTNTFVFEDNEDYEVLITNTPLVEVTQVQIIVQTINKQFAPAIITELTISSVLWYNQEKIITMDLLEELSYSDSIETLGGISANELTLALDNNDGQFYFNNPDSLIAKQLKKNRKILPYLGVYIGDVLEWYPLGVYWSYNWDVPVRGLHATVTAFDTMGLLNTTTFSNHQVYLNYSIGALAELILTDAKTQYSELEWIIDADLYDITIPYAWFSLGMHMAALEKLARCARINIYCDRFGRIIARPRYKYTGTKYDTWSDSTNVTNKTYPTLNTSVPNTINVYLSSIKIENTSIISDTNIFSVTDYPTKIITSGDPIKGNFNLTITKSATVNYTYELFSWGCVITFTGTGNVTAINATADVLKVEQTSMVTRTNDSDIRLNGIMSTDIKSDFIQNASFAKDLAESILADAQLDIYDTDVEYRGDISLTPNDPIELLDGIAPTTNYFIKRHELSWDGSLRGKAKLNT